MWDINAFESGDYSHGSTSWPCCDRKKFKGTNALKKHINPTRIPIEEKESWRWLENLKQSTELLSQLFRCVHIGDRESDIYELFCMAQELDTHFLVRTCVDRLIEDGKQTVADKMQASEIQGIHTLEFQDAEGVRQKINLELKYERLQLLAPVSKQKKYPSLGLTVIHAEEKETPTNRERIVWKLLTDLPINSMYDAVEKLHWYALRWRIETFHKILKSGCKADSSKLRTAQRITNLIAMFCILSWRIFWMTMINRSSPDASPEMVFTVEEIKLLDQLIKTKQQEEKAQSLASYLIKTARLGGYLARKSDPPPGFIVIWRGFLKLADILHGYLLGKNTCG
ncbi:TPA: IS4 family transposase [Legionella pneumophila]|nr:IS4 family transposase [Legionella pneumophila]